MRHRDKAQLVFNYLREELRSCSIGHKWDIHFEADSYFILCENRHIRLIVPKILLESNNANEIKLKLENFRLADCIRQNGKNFIILTNSGLLFENKRKGQKDRRKKHTYIGLDRRSGVADRRHRKQE